MAESFSDPVKNLTTKFYDRRCPDEEAKLGRTT
jgi:hypothetical protein